MFNEVYEKRRIRSVYSPVINWAKSLPESTILKRKNFVEKKSFQKNWNNFFSLQ